LFVHVNHIGLVNIIAGKTIAPEFIQGDATPARLAEAMLDILGDEGRRQAIREELAAIKNKLGQPGASDRAAALALEML
jgi:lipid-A-disaccharide synthase